MIQGRSPASARAGSIEVIVGGMFSGKTEELLRLLRRARLARQAVQVFKPKVDDRYSGSHVASHDKSLMTAHAIERAAELYEHLKPETRVVGLDEGQFFDLELVDVCNDLADRGLRVIVAGLDMNWRGRPFLPMPELMAVAERVRKLQAVCAVCGLAASRSQRLAHAASDVHVGGYAAYEPRCRECFDDSLGAHPGAVPGTAAEFDLEGGGPPLLPPPFSPPMAGPGVPHGLSLE